VLFPQKLNQSVQHRIAAFRPATSIRRRSFVTCVNSQGSADLKSGMNTRTQYPVRNRNTLLLTSCSPMLGETGLKS
jgi:hypothetical protein